MKPWRLTALLMALMFLLTGCTAPAFLTDWLGGEPAEPADAFYIYRVSTDPADGGSLLRGEAYPSAGLGPEAVLALFTAPPQRSGLAGALPEGVSVDSWSLVDGVAVLTFSPSYLDLPEIDRSVAAVSAALTLCQLDEVDAVTVAADGQIVYAGLLPEDALLDAAAGDPYTRQLRLYFPDAAGRYLLSEYHSLTLDEETSPERYVIEELLRGPNSGELSPVMPGGTRLLSCATEGGVCTVDFSREFYDARPATALGERLLLYAVTDSLTALPGVDSVRILVEGQPVDTYVRRSLAEPLTRYDEAVGPVSAPKGELDADLYLAVPGLQGITPLPFRVAGADYASEAEAVLAALLAAQEPGYPVVFPGSGSVIDVTVQGTVCTVDLSESFFVSLPEEARGLAVSSIAATLCALPDIAAVRFTVSGGPALFDGEDWSGPWRQFEEIEVN